MLLRQQYGSLMRRFFSRELRGYRTRCMAPRSYADLEHGICGCSGLTVMLFLARLGDEEILRVVHSARKELKEGGDHGVV